MHRGLLAAVGILCAAGAQAYSLFDFEEFNATSSASGSPGALTSLTSTKSGLTLTLTRSSGLGFDVEDNDSLASVGSFMPLTFDHRSIDIFAHPTTNDFMVGNFSTAVRAAEVEMTDFGGDSDALELQVWSGANGTGTMLADQFVSWGTASSPDFAAVGWNAGTSGAQAMSILFRGGSSDFPNSMYMDNVAAVAVPEPASIAGVAVGLALILKRRKK